MAGDLNVTGLFALFLVENFLFFYQKTVHYLVLSNFDKLLCDV